MGTSRDAGKRPNTVAAFEALAFYSIRLGGSKMPKQLPIVMGALSQTAWDFVIRDRIAAMTLANPPRFRG